MDEIIWEFGDEITKLLNLEQKYKAGLQRRFHPHFCKQVEQKAFKQKRTMDHDEFGKAVINAKRQYFRDQEKHRFYKETVRPTHQLNGTAICKFTQSSDLWLDLKLAISTLPEQFHEISKLHFIGGHAAADIAVSLNKDPTTIYRLLAKVRCKLRYKLADYYDGEWQELPS